MRIRGYRFFFYSNERGEPPHIHVEKGEGYAKYWLGPPRLALETDFRPKALKAIEKLIIEHQEKIMERWYDFFFFSYD